MWTEATASGELANDDYDIIDATTAATRTRGRRRMKKKKKMRRRTRRG